MRKRPMRRVMSHALAGLFILACGKIAPLPPPYDYNYFGDAGDGAPVDLDALFAFDSGPPLGQCTPATCQQLGYGCGLNSDGCNGMLDCGTCAAPHYCGGGGYSKCGGISLDSGAACTPATCASLGINCGPAGDGCGGTIAGCGTCPAPEVCGGGGAPSVCGGNDSDAGSCTDLCLQQMNCGGSLTTTITGTVFAPTPPLYGQPDPLYNAFVYVPNGTVQPFTPGISCDVCGAPASGNPLVSYTTGPTGQFTLSNAPCGQNIPLVIQLGRWRRQITIPSVACCTNTQLTADQTRLPRKQSEGDIPAMAIVTGSADPIECVLPKIGVDLSEFTDPGGGGRVSIYQADSAGAGAYVDANTPLEDALWGNPAVLDLEDLVIFDCQGEQYDESQQALTNILNYANTGGRVFASHYSYVWLYDNGPFATTAVWALDNSEPPDPLIADIDTSFQKGQDLAAWLGNVGALSGPDQIQVQAPRNDTTSVNVPPSQQFLSADPSMSPNNPLEFTFNTPVGATSQCGRVLFSDFHVNTGGAGTGSFPGECPVEPMTPQEKLLEFMLFDLTSCVQTSQPPPLCTPQTCASLKMNCGPAADGCGGLLQCGTCTAPATCGGGDAPGMCGMPGVCVPMTCGQQGYSCGQIGDGCGNLLQCGTCVPPQFCGGGGTPGVCGGGIQ
jgi:hypothetical protein